MWHELRFQYDKRKIDALKEIPGVKPRYEIRPDGTKKFVCWLAPTDALAAVNRILEHEMPNVVRRPEPTPVLIDGALPFQAIGVGNLIRKPSFMLAYEPGLGKTPTTIWALNSLHNPNVNPKPTLVVVAANTREHWSREFKKWWPDHPAKTVIRERADWADWFTVPTPIVVCSYELLEPGIANKWDIVVLDEAHYIKDGKAQRSKNVAAIRANNPDCRVIELTGTPISNEPKDLWHQLEILCPEHFGSYWKFVNRYCNVKEHEYGHDITGIKNADELNERLAYWVQRVTKHEVAHLLPALRTSTLYVKQRHLKDLDELTEMALEGYQSASADKKVECVADLFDEHRTAGRTRFVALTHLKSTVTKLGEVLRARGYDVLEVTGDVTEKDRYAAMDAARAATKPTVFVATMHSVEHGVDLTFAEIVAFAELYPRPSTMIQALGRFQRLSSTHGVNVYFIVVEGSYEEAIARVVSKKLDSASQVIKAGLSDEAAAGIYDKQQSDEELAAELAALVEET